ncbi:MAG TPA: type II toxin-antitoxin system RelE/ParE family toxin [Saprospiraceae bacterium]|nr:type II toxin-antitoxin system RelE/ParE family toxin [Saprospiraceae bacterium]
MNKPVVWSEKAKKELIRLKEFYDERNKSSNYSKKLFKTFQDASKLIGRFPYLSIATDYNNVRGFLILDFIIFYEIVDKHILILFIWDCHRDPEQLRSILGKY